jgi:hypothetical protein
VVLRKLVYNSVDVGILGGPLQNFEKKVCIIYQIFEYNQHLISFMAISLKRNDKNGKIQKRNEKKIMAQETVRNEPPPLIFLNLGTCAH